MKLFRSVSLAGLAAFAFVAAPVHALDPKGGGGLFMMPPGGETLSDALSHFGEAGGPGQGAAAATDASYRPDPAVRRKLAETMGKAAEDLEAGRGAEMRQLVLSGQALQEYAKFAPALGLRTNDAIDGLAFYLLAQWGVANDYRPMFTPRQVSGVRRQASAAFASVADQVNSDALRQEFGEMLVVQGMIMAGVHENAVKAGDEAAVRNYADIARRGGTRVLNADPTTIELTDEGFRRK